MTISPSQQNPYYQNNPFGTSSYVAPASDFDPMSIINLQQQLNEQVSLKRSNMNESIFAPSSASYVITPNIKDMMAPKENPEATAESTAEKTDSKDDLGVMGGIGRILASPVKFAWEVIKSGGKYIKNVFCGAWRATGGAIGTLLSGHPIDALGEVLGGCWDVIKAPFELLWDVGSDCVNFVGDVLGGAGNILEGVWDGVCSFFKGIFS